MHARCDQDVGITIEVSGGKAEGRQGRRWPSVFSRWLQEGGQPALRWVQAGERGVLYARNCVRIERSARHPPVHNLVDLVCVCVQMSRITFHEHLCHNTLNLAYRRVAQRFTLATPSHRRHALAVHLRCISTACHAIEISPPSCDAHSPHHHTAVTRWPSI